jgi:hypothetical protein
MQSNDPWLVAFYCIAGVSMLCSFGTTIHLIFFGNFNDFRISLLLLLHATIFIQCCAYLPIIYLGDAGLCSFMGFLHHYMGFAHVIVEVLMGIHHYCYIINEARAIKINTYIAKYGLFLIFLIPSVTTLPFSTNSYGESMGLWCDLPPNNRTANDWALITYFCPVFALILFTMCQLFYAIYRLGSYDKDLRQYLFLSTGVYVFISTFSDLPRIILRMIYYNDPNQPASDVIQIRTILPLYFTGILYFIVYILGLIFLSSRVIPGYNDYTMFTLDSKSFQEILDTAKFSFSSRPSSSMGNSMTMMNRDSALRTSNVENPIRRSSAEDVEPSL